MVANHHKTRHKNLILLGLGLTLAIALAVILGQSSSFKELIMHLGKFGYIGAFIAGVLFSSTFTIATGSVILVTLAQYLPIPFVVVIGVIGALTGDFFIFKFVKNDVEDEIKPIYNELLDKSHIKKILHTKYFSWTLPVLGTFIIASPLPDELGISLMGLAQIKMIRFLAISMVSHTIGMSTLLGITGIF
jgi:hypothetical protein